MVQHNSCLLVTADLNGVKKAFYQKGKYAVRFAIFVVIFIIC